MAIKLISKDERRTFTHSDAKVFYKRMPHDAKAALLQRFTKMKKGVEHTDHAGFMKAFLTRTVIGWEGFQNEDGTPAEFSIESIFMIPEPVIIELIEHMDSVDDDETDAHLGN